MEKSSVAPVFPLQALSAWGEECLTTIPDGERWVHSSALRREMVWKCVEIGDS